MNPITIMPMGAPGVGSFGDHTGLTADTAGGQAYLRSLDGADAPFSAEGYLRSAQGGKLYGAQVGQLAGLQEAHDERAMKYQLGMLGHGLALRKLPYELQKMQLDAQHQQAVNAGTDPQHQLDVLKTDAETSRANAEADQKYFTDRLAQNKAVYGNDEDAARATQAERMTVASLQQGAGQLLAGRAVANPTLAEMMGLDPQKPIDPKALTTGNASLLQHLQAASSMNALHPSVLGAVAQQVRNGTINQEGQRWPWQPKGADDPTQYAPGGPQESFMSRHNPLRARMTPVRNYFSPTQQ